MEIPKVVIDELENDFRIISNAIEEIGKDMDVYKGGVAKGGKRIRKNLLILMKTSKNSRGLILATRKKALLKEKEK